MIKHIKHQYHKLSCIKTFFLGVFVVVLAFVAMFRSLHASEIPFSEDIASIFWWLDTWYYSNTYFKYWGNNFVGIIFWQENLTGLSQTITINSWSTSDEKILTCTEQLRGIYYNSQRWPFVWPLDTWNLARLTGASATGYDDMTIEHGLFTNCTLTSWGYSPQANEVYGQVIHALSWVTGYAMYAGLEYDFGTNSISGGTSTLSFSGSMRILTWVHEGYIFDTHGGIAELGMNIPWCSSFEVSPTDVPYWEDTIFLCEGNSVTGYKLDIFLSWTTSPLYTELNWNTGNSSAIRLTWSALASWDYTAMCTILLNDGMWWPQCGGQIPFTVWSGTTPPPPSWSGCAPDFQGTISFGPLSDTILYNPSLGNYYTNTTGIMLQWAATAPNSVYISWNFVGSPIASWYMGTDIFNHLGTSPIELITSNNWNNFSSSFTTGDCTYIGAPKRVWVDTIPPTAPVITIPTSGAHICPSLPLSLQRSAAEDDWAWIAYYIYQVYNNSWMTTWLVISDITTATGTSIDISYLPLWTYYMEVLAVDNVGLLSESTPIHFTTSQSYCPTGTGVMIVSPIISITNADLDTVYRSDPIYILGLTWPRLLTISSGMLFINNGTGIGTTGLVTSNDTIYIELISSTSHDTTVSSTLSIMGTTWSFSVTTKPSNCVLSAWEKLVIQNIYQTLKANYNNDIYKLADFLYTFQSMVNDEIELTNSCTLEYLLRLIEDDLWFEWGIDTSNHIAPNCKEYNIWYEHTEKAYYSPNMRNRYYFINRESIIRHIDYYNPGDCHVNTYGTNYWTQDTSNPMRHVAPNGKIYNIVGQYGGFSALEFISPRYFDSLDAIRQYININNPSATIWQHTIDTSFFPIVYAAPNGKEYRILKTSRWFMSYKLMKVQYFSSLWELKGYIDRNNPGKR